LPRIQFVGKHYVVNNTGNVGNENKWKRKRARLLHKLYIIIYHD
jgi:hypothetical protein